MWLSIKKVSLGIILVIALLALASADDDDDKKAEQEEEEKDPWDKSTDKYRHHLGDGGGGTHSEEPVKIDVTEVSESEVHSERSKVCKNCKLKNMVARKSHSSKSPPATAAKDATKSADGKHVAAPQYFDKNEVDDETKEQINDATDEKDPVDTNHKEATGSASKREHEKQHHKRTKHRNAQASKKQLNPQIDYYPGNVWEYPYPYHHDIKYGCGANDQNCDAKIEAKEEAKEQDKKSKTKKKAGVGRVTNHAGHHQISEIGTSWETPCFYNADTKKFSCKQLIPSHYYGPPSAGWGGFQPGHTGGGWGTPHWNKRCHTPQLSCKSYSRPSMRNSWFFYNPREKKIWDPAAWYRYKSAGLRGDTQMQGSMRYKVSRPEETINRITPLVIANPHMRNNIGALHEWINFLENEREKDRELERFRLQMKDRENQRRYNLDVLHYQSVQNEPQPLAVQVANEHPLKPLHRDASRISYYSKLPTLAEQQNYEKKTIDYVLHSGLASTLYNDRK